MIRSTTCPWAGTFPVGKDIIYCDLTLREGEQSPGVTYTAEEKFELIRRLDDLGIGQIQLTTPGLNPTVLAIDKKICEMGLKAKTEIMTAAQLPTWKEQIDAANACGPDIIHAGFEVSQYNQKVWNEEVKQDTLKRIAEVTEYIKSTGKIVNISFTDATRAEFTFLLLCVEQAAKAGANRIRIADSFGVATPESFYEIISNAVRIAAPYGCKIGAHCHNDFGLALACCISCIKAGATLIDVCANGLGDRAGNVCLFELMVTLETLYKIPTGMKTEKIMELAKFVEQISGIPIPVSKPFVGANVFKEEAASHAIEQFVRPVYGRSIVPSDIGAKLGVIYGKYTDETVIRLTAEAAGRNVPEKFYPEILKQLYVAAEAKKGVPLYEEDFWAIVDKVMA